MNEILSLRDIEPSDCQTISAAFSRQGWTKPAHQFEAYVRDQEIGRRDVIIAELNQAFAGYLTIQWISDYPPFQERQIPEIVDLNVLKKCQRRGVGTALMAEAEQRIKTVSSYAGIGVGLYRDYGAAQVLYITRGYMPDGNGITRNSTPLHYDDTVIIDHSMALHLLKKL